MIRAILIFPNGNVGCVDEHGKAVPEWQGSLEFLLLREMVRARVVDLDDLDLRTHSVYATAEDVKREVREYFLGRDG